MAISFRLSAQDLQKVFNSAKVLSVSDITLHTKEGNIYMTVSNKSMSSSSDYVDVKVGECEPDLDISFAFKKQNLKLITDYDYDVTVYTVGLARFLAVNSAYEKFDVYVVTTPETSA